jgi:hypothetical protein
MLQNAINHIIRSLLFVLLSGGTVYTQAAAGGAAESLSTLANNNNNDTTDTSSRSQGPPYTTCDDQCQNQVKILEGFIAFLILGFALGVGVCCMKCIDTPSSSSLAQQSASRAMAKKRD